MQIVVCVSLLVVYGRLYSVVGDCQLNVEERQMLANSKPLSLFKEGFRNRISIASLMRRLNVLLSVARTFCFAGIHRMSRELAMFVNG